MRQIRLHASLIRTTTMPESKITVLYFAAASTATGKTTETISLPEGSSPFRLSALSLLLASRYPESNLAKVLQGSQWSVDAEMIDNPDECILSGGEEVAVICPVSGG